MSELSDANEKEALSNNRSLNDTTIESIISPSTIITIDPISKMREIFPNEDFELLIDGEGSNSTPKFRTEHGYFKMRPLIPECGSKFIPFLLTCKSSMFEKWKYLFKEATKRFNYKYGDNLTNVLQSLKTCWKSKIDSPFSRLNWIKEKLKMYDHTTFKDSPSTFTFMGNEFKLPLNCIFSCESANVFGFEVNEIDNETIIQTLLLLPSMFIHSINLSKKVRYQDCFCFLTDSKGKMISFMLEMSYTTSGENIYFKFESQLLESNISTLEGFTKFYSHFESFTFTDAIKCKYSFIEHHYYSLTFYSQEFYCMHPNADKEGYLEYFNYFCKDIESYKERKRQRRLKRKQMEIEHVSNNLENDQTTIIQQDMKLNEETARTVIVESKSEKKPFTEKQLELKRRTEMILKTPTNFIK